MPTYPKRILLPAYTLVELVVVIGLLVLTVGSILAFLTSSLKGSNQVNVISEVKQNGQAVLDSLDRQIRNATDATQSTIAQLPAGASSGVSLTIAGANSLYIACFTPTASANGWIGVASSASGLTPTLSDYKPVTNQDTVLGVDIQSCSLSVLPVSSGEDSPPVVSVSFLVNQGIAAPTRSDFLANAQFQTTISLRKY